jgi:hypothetical protein
MSINSLKQIVVNFVVHQNAFYENLLIIRSLIKVVILFSPIFSKNI